MELFMMLLSAFSVLCLFALVVILCCCATVVWNDRTKISDELYTLVYFVMAAGVMVYLVSVLRTTVSQQSYYFFTTRDFTCGIIGIAVVMLVVSRLVVRSIQRDREAAIASHREPVHV